jgi:hypothetical protein
LWDDTSLNGIYQNIPWVSFSDVPFLGFLIDEEASTVVIWEIAGANIHVLVWVGWLEIGRSSRLG